ncbi:MAG TPA: tetratricopeptide repeat protein [Ktedonobacteraceae bacterium]|nr:tetratricopeptide repeat protein [Ktedonobacteraceae bacterium]
MLSIRERMLTHEHLEMAHSLHELAEVSRQRGKYAEAEPLYQRALSIWEQQFSPEHPETAETLLPFQAYFQKRHEEMLLQQAEAVKLWYGTDEAAQLWPPVVPLRTVGLIPDGHLHKNHKHPTIIFHELIPGIIRHTMHVKGSQTTTQHGLFLPVLESLVWCPKRGAQHHQVIRPNTRIRRLPIRHEDRIDPLCAWCQEIRQIRIMMDHCQLVACGKAPGEKPFPGSQEETMDFLNIAHYFLRQPITLCCETSLPQLITFLTMFTETPLVVKAIIQLHLSGCDFSIANLLRF